MPVVRIFFIRFFHSKRKGKKEGKKKRGEAERAGKEGSGSIRNRILQVVQHRPW